MDDDEVKQAIERLGSHELQRVLATLLLDSTVRVRDLLACVEQQGEAAEWSRVSHANEIAHTVAGFLLSNGDRSRFPNKRLIELIREASRDGLIQYSSFAKRALGI
jgi:hypothetical protein